MREFKVDKNSAGVRADVFVAAKFPLYSRSALKGLFEAQKVHINRQPAKPGKKLDRGSRVVVDVTLLKSATKRLKLPVLYDDKDVVVINKPPGILTHSKGALNLEPTVATFIKNRIKDKTLQGNRAGIVHRLDRGTSGVIICAKTAQALAYLQKQFTNRRVKKTYMAVVEGVVSPPEAIIDAPIARSPKKPQSFKVSSSGKPARTSYRLIKNTDKHSFLELNPETGRTHQLRVHLAYIRHPVLGDPLYGHGSGEMYLHAHKLELTLPNGKKRVFTAPIPAKFRKPEVL